MRLRTLVYRHVQHQEGELEEHCCKEFSQKDIRDTLAALPATEL